MRAIISLLTVHVTPKIRLYTCKMLLSFAILNYQIKSSFKFLSSTMQNSQFFFIQNQFFNLLLYMKWDTTRG